MLSLIKHVAYSSVNVLMIENIQPQRLNDETMLIIDKDLCEILVKSIYLIYNNCRLHVLPFKINACGA